MCPLAKTVKLMKDVSDDDDVIVSPSKRSLMTRIDGNLYSSTSWPSTVPVLVVVHNRAATHAAI